MDWRRWDSLEKQALTIIPQMISLDERINPTPLTNDVQLEDTRIYDNVPTEPNLDPFRNDSSGRQRWLHNLRAARAVIP